MTTEINRKQNDDIRPVFIAYPAIYSLLILNYLVYKCNVKFVGIILSASYIKIKAKTLSLMESFLFLNRRSGLNYALYMFFISKFAYFFKTMWNLVSRIKGKNLNLKTFKRIAQEKNIPLIRSKDINNRITFDFMRNINTNLIVSAYNNQIIRYRICKVFLYRGINIHNSYLPDFGGLDAAFENLYRKVNEAGATIHYLDKTIDTGDIIVQKKIPIYPQDTVFSLNIRQWLTGATLLPEVLTKLRDGRVERKKQDLSEVKYPYRSFPSRKRVKVLLKRRKKRLISFKEFILPPDYLCAVFD